MPLASSLSVSLSETVDNNLNQLEKDIRQLKIEYETYFGGGRLRPPTDLQWRIETMVKRYSDRGAEMNYGQRFRYGNLIHLFSKYREIFQKRLRQREEGTVQRHFGAAARKIEEERMRKRVAERQRAMPAQFPFAVTCTDPAHEKEKVQELYAAFRSAKKKAGEDTERFTLEAFQQFLLQKTDQLKSEKKARAVEYVVILDGEHARLKARVKS